MTIKIHRRSALPLNYRSVWVSLLKGAAAQLSTIARYLKYLAIKPELAQQTN